MSRTRMTRRCDGGRRRGFSLLELLVVIAISALLLTFAVTSFKRHRRIK
jgi:prepilin-type N-terminal cleavage/methylation domain-containing protein